LSEGGAFLSRPATNFNPAPATRCRLDCVLPPPVDAVVQLEVEIVRQGKDGFGVRLLNVSESNRTRLRAVLPAGGGGSAANQQRPGVPVAAQPREARGILRRLLEQRLPSIITALQEEMLNRLLQASDSAASDAERMALMDDVWMLSHAVRQQRLLEPMRRVLASVPERSGDEPVGYRNDDEEHDLELVDTEQFEISLASAALKNMLDEQLDESLREMHNLARAAFSPNSQLPVDPSRFAAALETALSELGLSSLSIALCLREASGSLVDSLGVFYAELVSAWKSVGLTPLPEAKASKQRPRISDTGESAASPPESGPGTEKPVGPPAASAESLSDWVLSLPPRAGSEEGIAPEVKQQLMDLLSEGSGAPIGRNARLSERVGAADLMLTNMLRDSRVPPSVKYLIKQLSNKFLALALGDERFFRDASHPLVNVIDQLEHLNVLLPGSAQLKGLVERAVATDIRNLDELRSISSEIDMLVRRHSGAIQRNSARLIASLEGKENLREARLQVRELMNRTFAGRMMNTAVVRLVDEGWRNLLELTALRQGSNSPVWRQYWQTLLGVHFFTGGSLPVEWHSPLERATLDASLREGLTYVGLNAFHRRELLSLLNAAMDAAQDQRLNQSDLVEFRKISVDQYTRRRPAQRPKELSTEEWDRALEQVDGIEVGSRLDLDAGGGHIRRRLVWRSGDGVELVFTDELGKNLLEMRRDKLAELLSQGKAEVRPRSELGITGRAMAATLDQFHERIVHRQHPDPLTGLSTRTQIIGELSRLISSESGSAERAAFGCLAPDHFEEMIGSSGYAAGDELLRTIGTRLQEFLPDALCIAYMGRSRFGFLAPAEDSSRAHELAERVRSAMAMSPFTWDGKPYPVATSLGVTLVSPCEGEADLLLSAADTACTAARRAGGDRVILFRETDEAIARERAAVDGWIKAEEVVRAKRIRLRCQRIAATDPAEDAPLHHEILLSVFDEEGNALPLMDFIRSAEAFHRMAEVDRLVVEKSFSWVHANPESAACLGGIAINLSGQSLGNEVILEQIREALQRTGVDPKMVGFEVTETAAIANLDRAVTIIEGIREMGCRVALDDFGTGMSSYSYLKRLPVDYLKIDGSFVRDILSSPTDEAIVKSINEVAHFMGKQTIAEFVCDEPIRERLQEIGVDYVQGYAVAKPAYLDEMVQPGESPGVD
jgi:diguanylate cyclase (GGDEF)-like protein